MIRTLARVLRGVLWLALSVLLVATLASVAVTTGIVDIPGEEPSVETPEPLPDWPFAGELPIGGDLDVDTEPRPETAADAGDPVREDPGTTSTDLGGAEVTSAEIEALIHERVNAIRAEEGLSRLDHDDEIASIARTYSADMATREYFSHVSPEGETIADRFGDTYPTECDGVGENLGYVRFAGPADADDVAERIVDGWLDSESHRENLLADAWDRQGIGVFVDGERVYATQNFCRSR